MVNDKTESSPFPGRSNFRLRLRIYRIGTRRRKTQWRWRLQAINPTNYSQTWAGGSYPWSVTVEGRTWSGSASALDFRDGASYHTIASGTTGYVQHNLDGYRGINAKGSYGGSLFGVASVSVNFGSYKYENANRPGRPILSQRNTESLYVDYGNLPWDGGSGFRVGQIRIDSSGSSFPSPRYHTDNTILSTPFVVSNLRPGVKYWVQTRLDANAATGWSEWSPTASITLKGVPDAPNTPSLTTTSPTTIDISYNHPDSNGATIQEYQIQVATDSGFSDIVKSPRVTWRSGTITALSPGTRHYMRVRARNSEGWGPWSSSAYRTTFPADPPALLSVTPATDGRSYQAQAQPPSGLNPDSWVWSFTINDGSTVYTRTSSGASREFVDRTPGRTYHQWVQYRVGAYLSDPSNTITVTMPDPSVDPGGYWDGDTAASGDVTYEWTGTPGASDSIQQAADGVLGWTNSHRSLSQPNSPEITSISGGVAVQSRTTDNLIPVGHGGEYAALYRFLESTSTNGARFGTDGDVGYAEVVAGGAYVASIWVRSSKTRIMAAAIVWFDASGSEISVSEGGLYHLTAGLAARPSVSAVAPIGAAKAGVIVTDPAGQELFETGDSITVEGAMLSVGILYPYFDGDTPDTSRYDYGWEGPPNESPSTRITLAAGEVNLLNDPDCPTPPAPPQPPQIADDCIVAVGEWRRFWIQVPSTQLRHWLTVVPTVTITTQNEDVRQVRIRFYANPENLEPEDAYELEPEAEQIVRYIPANTELTLDGISEQAWAVVDGSDSLRADHLLYGEGGGPATWSPMRCGSPYLVSFDVPTMTPEGNLFFDMSLTTRMM
ncbi:MAG: fibronectin type III domain-containing protein [Brachybacterium sp.]